MSKYDLIPNDLYPTPGWATASLLPSMKIRGPIWEPAAGKLHMVKVFRASGYETFASDITKRPGVVKCDFLTDDCPFLPEWRGTIITNPPYSGGLADKFVRRALELAAPFKGQVAMLLKAEFDYGKTRLDIFQHHPCFRFKLVLTQRLLIPGFKHVASPMKNHAWYVWDFGGLTVQPTHQLKWI